jgi:hypothetical protein
LVIVSWTSPRFWMKPSPPLPLIAFEPPVPLMIQVSPPKLGSIFYLRDI